MLSHTSLYLDARGAEFVTCRTTGFRTAFAAKVVDSLQRQLDGEGAARKRMISKLKKEQKRAKLMCEVGSDSAECVGQGVSNVHSRVFRVGLPFLYRRAAITETKTTQRIQVAAAAGNWFCGSIAGCTCGLSLKLILEFSISECLCHLILFVVLPPIDCSELERKSCPFVGTKSASSHQRTSSQALNMTVKCVF